VDLRRLFDIFFFLTKIINLSIVELFNGISPNGLWKLFVRDDLGGDIGAIAQGWELAIQTA